MKQLCTILSLCLALTSYGQDLKNLGKTFVMKQNYKAKKCDAIGGNQINSSDPLERKFIIIVEAMIDKGYVISVPSFTVSTRKNYLNETFVQTSGIAAIKDAEGNVKTAAKPEKRIYFFIPFTDFSKVCERSLAPNSFTAGIPTLPVKLRFGNGGEGEDPRYFRFEGNVSLGLSAGWKHSFGEDKKYAFNLLAGFTIASVEVDSATTRGRVASKTAAASFSPHLGVVFDVQRFQFGLYTGFDFLYGEPNKYWVYRNQPWLGIGIGYSLFKTDKDNSKTPNNKGE
ncbi:MAG: hypothetical protein ACRBFS_17630 [Aureispira sp.]